MTTHKTGCRLILADRPCVQSEGDLLLSLRSPRLSSMLILIDSAHTATPLQVFGLVDLNILPSLFLPSLKAHEHFRSESIY